jgi:hypothetical protein
MKAILEFNLPEEANEHKQAIEGGRWELALWELDQDFRSIHKYGDDVVAADFAEKARTKIREHMDSSGLSWSQ